MSSRGGGLHICLSQPSLFSSPAGGVGHAVGQIIPDVGPTVQAPKTKGPGWFDLPAQTLDEEKKMELRLLRLRGAYDPKRFYKTFDTTKLLCTSRSVSHSVLLRY